MVYRIDFRWDDDASVWIATSADVPGLVLESGSFDALVERVKLAVPELLELNGVSGEGCRLSCFAERDMVVSACG